MKWLACRDAPGERKVVVCNADEGEPGTFKDRVLLHRHAELVFEGMTLAAWATGAREGFLYLRGEYAWLRPRLEAAAGGAAARPACWARGFSARRVSISTSPSTRRGRLRVRRGDLAAGVARGASAARRGFARLPGHAWLPRPPHGGEQRRDAGQDLPHRARDGGRPSRQAAPPSRRGPSCCRFRATVRGPACTSIPSA